MIGWMNFRRLLHIISVIARHGLAHSLGGRIARWPALARRLPASDLLGPDRLRAVIEDIGGMFIKLGQMLSLQPDILPLEYCTALFDLLDRIAPFGFEQVEKTFREELGRVPSALFDSVEPQPLATASIGQVHVAYLDGRKLAVKVQRPSVEREFAGDIRLMSATVGLIKRLRIKKLYWMVEPLTEFVAWTGEELDYRSEARYMEQLRNNARGKAYECVPEVFWDYTTRRTLVAEFLDGVTMLEYLRALETGDELVLHRLKASGFDPNQFACNIVDNFLSDACRHGMFHADLHPANLIILPNNVVGYIDFGITGLLSHYSSHNLVALTLAFTRADLDQVYTTFIKSSALGPNADIERFRKRLKGFADDWYEIEGRERRLQKSFTLVMLDMLGLSRETDVWPERDIIKYIRSAIAIDGLISRFAPGFNLAHYLEQICDRYLKWHVRRALLSYETLVGWSSSGGQLITDGALRLAGVLDRFATSQLRSWVTSEETAGVDVEALRLGVIGLAIVVFMVALLLTVTREHIELGVNLFTAEIMLVVAATGAIFRTMRKLA
jgi:ubiquinone biosynthesis protein